MTGKGRGGTTCGGSAAFSALPPPNYDDALLYPGTSHSCSDMFGDAARATGMGGRSPRSSLSDTLPSYDTACRSQFSSSPTSSSSPRRPQPSPSPGQRSTSSGASASLSQASRLPAPSPSTTAQSRAGITRGQIAAHAHGVTIQVSRLEEMGGLRHQPQPPFLQGLGGGAGSAFSKPRRTSSQSCGGGRNSLGGSGSAGGVVAGATGFAHGSSTDLLHARSLTASQSTGAGMDSPHRGSLSHRLEVVVQNSLSPHPQEDMGRRHSDGSCLLSAGQRSRRSCSDAGIHDDSRTHNSAGAAAAAAAGRRASSLLPASAYGNRCQHHHDHHHHHNNHQHHQRQQHRSHSCIPDGSVHNGGGQHTCGSANRRSHSHSSIWRLAAAGTARGHPRSGSVDDDEGVTYVWKDNRVQQVYHHNHPGYHQPGGHGRSSSSGSGLLGHGAYDQSSSQAQCADSGQHVQYIWRNGNVQRVVRGSNHEVLSAEVVPPREVKSINYCTVFGLMMFFVMAIVTLIIVFRVFH